MQPIKLQNIDFKQKSGVVKDKNESPEQKRERKMFQSVCDTYQKIVYEAENKVFSNAVKLPARRQKLKVFFDQENGYQIQMANSMEEKQLFAIFIITTILNQPRIATYKLCENFMQEAKNLYTKAKEQKLEFFQFPEFIEHHMNRFSYDRDVEFNLYDKVTPAPPSATDRVF